MKKMISLVFSILLTACASNYNNGVTTWSEERYEQPELLETQQYEKYVVEEKEAPLYVTEVVEVEEPAYVAVSSATPSSPAVNTATDSTQFVTVADNTPVRVVDEVRLYSSATRPAELVVPATSTNLPSKVIVDNGKCFARLRYPAKYVSKVLKEEVAPQTYEYVTLPAEYRWTQKLVTNSVTGESEYKTVKQLVKPAQKVKRVVPAQYAIKKAGGSVYQEAQTKLSRVVCEENLTTDLVTKIQSSLSKAGYNAGPTSGYMNARTLDALQKFQLEKGLPTGGVTLDTLSMLGVYSYNF